MELQQERDYPYYRTNFLIEQHWLEKCWNQFTCREKSKTEYFWKAAFQTEHVKIATIGVILFTFPFFMYNNGVVQAPRKIFISTLWDRGLCSVGQAGCIHGLLPQLCSGAVQLALFQTFPPCHLPEPPLTTVLSLTWSQHGYYSQNAWYQTIMSPKITERMGLPEAFSVIVHHKEVRLYSVL